MLYHCGGKNQTSAERRAVNHLYSIPYFKQQIELPSNMEAADLSPKEKAILGFGYHMPRTVEEYLASRERKHGQP
jgi:ectoine hydroxylase-related dioxygenase (phytanoyl-CoA dioxygenase family)